MDRATAIGVIGYGASCYFYAMMPIVLAGTNTDVSCAQYAVAMVVPTAFVSIQHS